MNFVLDGLFSKLLFGVLLMNLLNNGLLDFDVLRFLMSDFVVGVILEGLCGLFDLVEFFLVVI